VRARRARQVKIAEGVYVVERVVKLTGGLVRLAAVVRDDRLHDAYLSGDFFFYPAEALVGLENDLEGAPAEAVGLQARIQAYFNAHRVEAPGISPADLAQVLAA
jgi:lipoate-protein ligase A